MGSFCAVLTTIHEPLGSARALGRCVVSCGSRLVVAGDSKGPTSYDLPNTTFLSLQDQLDGPFELGRKLPTGHYCRKNVAYLEAIRQGTTCIYETDDDNAPLPNWAPRSEYLIDARIVFSPQQRTTNNEQLSSRWVNLYKYFTDELIWPRGLPLDEIHTPVPRAESLVQIPGIAAPQVSGLSPHPSGLRAPIQQGLVNGSPDVDAIWRLVLDRPFEFDNRPSVYLEPGNWCPFNTQSTWWWPVVYPLLYIPSHCSFRMCDIWKSFVAQRCLWELGYGVAFHAPEVFQERNEHDLMRDFQDEVPGYDRNRELVEVLAHVALKPGESCVGENLLTCYDALVSACFFPDVELHLVQTWLSDLRYVV